ncbi:MAG: PEGA domain-containing protein [Planctomycetales bacterium]
MEISIPLASIRCLLLGRLLFAVLLVVSLTGCVERRLMIRSQPPGALVYVGKQEVGLTPVGVNFTYYGPREVTLVKDGYETVTEIVEVPPPWYQVVPLDFVSDNLVPARIRDYRGLEYQLRPKFMVSTEQILRRGDELRNAGRLGGPLHVVEPPPARRWLPPVWRR